MGTVILNERDQRRAEILSRVSSGSLNVCQASILLGVSERQARRLRERFQADGLASVSHGNRGRAPHNKSDAERLSEALLLAGEGGPYFGFSVCHLADLLAERHDLRIGRSTLDRLLRQKGIVKARRGRGKAAQRRHEKRERQPAEGMLLQIDGSPHDWLERRGPRLCLMGAIDDATGKVLYLRFHPTECQEAYLLLMRTICTSHGLPMAFYHDRHTILRSPRKATIDEELVGTEPMSQVQRVLHELGIESIAALSPQAKGRIERLWKTLQDRLVKEMRLEQIDTTEKANAFLPRFLERFNARFSVAAAESEPVWIPLPEDCDFARHFSAQEFRTVRADQSLAFLGKTLLVQGKRSMAGARVAVHVTPEGELLLYAGDKLHEKVPYKVVPEKLTPDLRKPKAEGSGEDIGQPQAQLAAIPTGAKRSHSPGQLAWLYGRKWT